MESSFDDLRFFVETHFSERNLIDYDIPMEGFEYLSRDELVEEF